MPDYPSPLTWFELQVCPREFRIGFVPGQPIFRGASGRATVLLSPEKDAAACAAVVAALDGALRRYRILESPVRLPNNCFEDEAALASPSVQEPKATTYTAGLAAGRPAMAFTTMPQG